MQVSIKMNVNIKVMLKQVNVIRILVMVSKKMNMHIIGKCKAM